MGEVVQSFRSEGLTYAAAYGVNGGGNGSSAEMTIISDGAPLTDMPLYGKRSLKNPRFVVRSSGGGGWGNPLEREPNLVLRDVVDGIVTAASAQAMYGVVLDPTSETVDRAANERLRAGRNGATERFQQR